MSGMSLNNMELLKVI